MFPSACVAECVQLKLHFMACFVCNVQAHPAYPETKVSPETKDSLETKVRKKNMQHYLLSLEYVAVCRLLMRASAKADDLADKSSAEAISRLVRHCTEPINDGIALCR